jgi:hypothetical protein
MESLSLPFTYPFGQEAVQRLMLRGMKHIYIPVLILALCLQAVPFDAFAAEEEPSTSELRAQLSAIKEYLSRIGNGEPAPLSEKGVRFIVEESTNWLLEAQQPSGHFGYEYVPYDDEYLNDDNIVRQGGALFALGEVYRKQTVKSEEVGKGIRKAVSYFESLSIEGGDKEEFRCVANTQKSSTCKLGTTALVLAGILGYAEASPEDAQNYEELIDDYTAYLLASQKKEGGFSNEYRVSNGFSEEESPFFNGEALLSLVRAYQYEEDEDVRASIDRAFTYLEKKEFESPLYLWIMAALKDMQKLWPNDAYVSYAQAFTAWRMEQASHAFNDRNYCAYIEGVASAYSVLQFDPQSNLELIRKEIDSFNAYHSALQLTQEDLYRVIANRDGIALKKLKLPERAQGGFLTAHSVPTQRIDFTQHCLSAYLQTLVDIDKKEL